MRCPTSILFAFLFLLQGAAPAAMEMCCELQKLPHLFSHFEEHRQINGETFLEFLAENYLDTESSAHGHHEDGHENLPFHGSHQCGHSVIFFCTDNSISIAIPEESQSPMVGFLWFDFSSNCPDSPFQPPKA